MGSSGSSDRKPNLRVILYDAGGHDREVSLDAIDIDGLAKQQLLWIDRTGSAPVELPLEMQGALHSAEDSGALEIFDTFYRFCIPTREHPDFPLRFAVGQSWVLTASEDRPKFFDDFLEADQGEALRRGEQRCHRELRDYTVVREIACAVSHCR